MSFTWTAPAPGTGEVEFRFAVVMVRQTYWANQLAMQGKCRHSGRHMLDTHMGIRELKAALKNPEILKTIQLPTFGIFELVLASA